jgi:hypothetical protein
MEQEAESSEFGLDLCVQVTKGRPVWHSLALFIEHSGSLSF